MGCRSAAFLAEAHVPASGSAERERNQQEGGKAGSEISGFARSVPRGLVLPRALPKRPATFGDLNCSERSASPSLFKPPLRFDRDLLVPRTSLP